MEKNISLLILCLFIFSCEDSEKFDFDNLTEEQLAIVIKNSTGALEARWQVLVLTFTEEKLIEFHKSNERILEREMTIEEVTSGMAKTYASLGVSAMHRKTCVKIQYPNEHELAYECAE